MASFYNNYYRYYRPYTLNASNPNFIEDKSSDTKNSNKDFFTETSTKEKKASRHYAFGPIHFKNPIFANIEEPIFEILGIQLYLDDIIIIGLLFFLYQEGVQDEMLYISLILLLLG